MARIVSLLFAVLVLTASCGDGGESGSSTTEPDATTTTSSSTTTDARPECSAAEVEGERDEAAGGDGAEDLPEAVARMRADIIDAALACDYQRLEELALAGEGSFTYSFGAEGDPAGHWREREQSTQGPKPMRAMIELLRAPHRTIEVQGATQHVWPSAFAYDNWQDVPEADREALRPLYSEDDFESFEQFGGYVGYRVGITADGDWIFFVAGD